MLLRFSQKIYSKEAIHRVIYDLATFAKYNFSLEENDYVVNISAINTPNNFNIESAFLQSLSDHQVRIELEEKYSTIRNLLVVKAIESGIDLTHMNLSND